MMSGSTADSAELALMRYKQHVSHSLANLVNPFAIDHVKCALDIAWCSTAPCSKTMQPHASPIWLSLFQMTISPTRTKRFACPSTSCRLWHRKEYAPKMGTDMCSKWCRKGCTALFALRLVKAHLDRRTLPGDLEVVICRTTVPAGGSSNRCSCSDSTGLIILHLK